MTFGQKMKLLFSGIWNFIGPFLMIFVTGSGQILADIAMRSVIQISNDSSVLTDDEKRKAAFHMILAELQQKGLSLGTSVINSAIEAAVQKLKSK